jgi:predicted HicB family RNase H-like nuclease
VKTADLNIRISPKLKEAARRAAEMDQRSLSSLVERLLTEHCHRAGTLKGRQ